MARTVMDNGLSKVRHKMGARYTEFFLIGKPGANLTYKVRGL